MSTIFRFVLTILLFISFSACQQAPLTYDYLMTHPVTLKKQLERCDQLADKTPDETAQCQVVTTARDNFLNIQEEREVDPIKFGTKILDLETACAEEKTKQCELVPLYLAVVGVNSPD